jgi:SAM-dependent methyltransferase
MRGEQVQRAFAEPEAYLSRRYHLRWRSEAVQAFVGARHFNRVIDYGCGDGSLSIPLLDQLDELILFDPSPAMLAAARAQVPAAAMNKVTLTESTAASWRERGPADLLLCVGVLGHVEDPLGVLADVASLVRPGGVAVLELTDVEHPVGRAQIIYSHLRKRLQKDRYAWNALRATDILARCREFGFEVKGTYRYGLPFDLSRFLPNELVYRLGLRLFGQVPSNTGSVVSCERLYYLHRR